MRRLWWVALLATHVAAQDYASATATVTPDTCQVGQGITYTARFTARRGFVGEFGVTPPEFLGFRLISSTPPSRTDNGAEVTFDYTYELAPQQSGDLLIQPFTVVWQDPVDGTSKLRATPRLTVRVRADDPDEDIRGPKPLVAVPSAMPVVWWSLAAVLALLLLTALLARMASRRRHRRLNRKPAVVVSLDPPKPAAHARALQRLADLEAEQLPARGLLDAYHVKLSQILRDYLGERFTFNAVESTTSEIADHLLGSEIPTGDVQRARQVLYGCDREKFAAWEPTVEDMVNLLERARDLVTRLAMSATSGGGRP